VAVAALATGIGTGLSGRLYDEGKSFVLNFFTGHTWTAYAIEPNPVCDFYEAKDYSKAFSDTGIYFYKWSVAHLSNSWSGISRKGKNSDASYWLVGTDRGSHTVIMYSSARGTDGIGAYILSQRDGEREGEDYFVGSWVGRECSIAGHPYIKCPMVVVRSQIAQVDAEKLVPKGSCEMSDPPLVAADKKVK
jgi:hypothetical protein